MKPSLSKSRGAKTVGRHACHACGGGGWLGTAGRKMACPICKNKGFLPGPRGRTQK